MHENLISLAMVEAAVRSTRTGTRIVIDEVLEQAHTDALAAERHDAVRERLAAWGSVRSALTSAVAAG